MQSVYTASQEAKQRNNISKQRRTSGWQHNSAHDQTANASTRKKKQTNTQANTQTSKHTNKQTKRTQTNKLAN